MSEQQLIVSALEEIIESDTTTSDDSDIEDLIIMSINIERIPRVAIKNYVEAIVPLYSDKDFKSHFRICRDTFQFLLELLTPDLIRKTDRYGRNTISPEKQLLLSIWMIATPNSYRCVSDCFNVSKSTAWSCVAKVVKALYRHCKTFIKWPTEEECRQTWTTIERKHKFPKTIGAIDGTHIKIAAPRNDPESYINRKGFHSIQLQVICDYNLKFINCYCGQVGSVHDARVFRLSGFQNMCRDVYFPENSHILGDAAYGIQNHIMVPFKNNGHLSEAQLKYNTCHSSARTMVERSLGLLKGRFRSILDKLPNTRTEMIPRYVIACCILHNICILKNDFIDIPIILNEPDIDEQVIELTNLEDRQRGIEKRNAITETLMGIRC